jgi:hypothetical protein
VVNADRIRAANPNARLFEYAIFRYYLNAEDAEEWAASNGHSSENFLLHYREDVEVPGYESIVLVPGFPLGFVPGWNETPAPDDPPATATEQSQSRVCGVSDRRGDPWYLANITDAGYREYLVDRTERLVDGSLYNAVNASGPVDGVMIDCAIYYPHFKEGLLDKTNEFYRIPIDDSHPYALGFLTFYADLREALDNRMPRPVDIMPNYSDAWWLNWPDPLSQGLLQVVDWVWAEVWVMYRGNSYPTNGSYRAISYERDYDTVVANIVRQTRAGGRRVLGARDIALEPMGSDRGRLFTLGLYYLVHNANTFYQYESFNGHYYRVPVSEWQWNPAVVYDIGQPAPVPGGYVDFEGKAATTEHYEIATGSDPYDPSLTYHVFARKFTKGMVLVKMLPIGSVVDEQSVTMHTLDRPYKILRSDGTASDEAVTEVSIRNNEGIILVLP